MLVQISLLTHVHDFIVNGIHIQFTHRIKVLKILGKLYRANNMNKLMCLLYKLRIKLEAE